MRHLVGIYVVADALVRGELHLVVLGVETGGWQDLLVLTFAGSGARPPVTLCGEGVEVLAGDLPLLGYAFGALTLVDEILLLQEIRIHLEACLAVAGVAEHRRPRHALRARGDGVANVARGYCLRDEMGRLLAGAAHAVEAHRRYRYGEAREQYAEPADVRPLFASLGDGAVHDVLDLLRVQPCVLQEPVEGMRQKGVGTRLAEGPAGFGERCAHRLEDYGLSHLCHGLSPLVEVRLPSGVNAVSSTSFSSSCPKRLTAASGRSRSVAHSSHCSAVFFSKIRSRSWRALFTSSSCSNLSQKCGSRAASATCPSRARYNP